MKLIFTWTEAHQAIASKLLEYRNQQQDLIDILKQGGVDSFNDEETPSLKTPLTEMEPFTFFSYIYKHGTLRNKAILKDVCRIMNIDVDVKDICGIPTSDARNVWYFPYRYERNNNEVQRLWNFFEKLLQNKITDADFLDVLAIKNVGKSKLLDGMFRIMPYEYLCFNGMVNEYIKHVKGIEGNYNNYTELKQLQERVRKEFYIDFPQLSYDAFIQKVYQHEPRYFRIGSKDKDTDESRLEDMLSNNVISIGWYDLGDIEKIAPLTKAGIQTALMNKGYYKDDKRTAARKAGEIYTFYDVIKPFDYVLVADGTAIKAIGRITSDNYFYLEDYDFPHSRNVEWIKININDLSIDEGLRTTVWQFEYPAVINEIETYLGIKEKPPVPTGGETPLPTKPKLPIFPLNIILYGPPGTGKTYNTIDKAVEIINGTSGIHDQNKEEFDKLVEKGQIAFVTFHQNYSYEDFIVGLKPNTEKEQLLFKEHKGICYSIAKEAEKSYLQRVLPTDEPKRFVLIIDEINRANISKVFGELITLLEEDKRIDGDNELKIQLPNKELFSLPPNLYIIGTMNTADKSIALVDIALRRRFEFIGMYPNSQVLEEAKFSDKANFLKLINKKIYEKRKSADFLIGHAYLLGKTPLEDIILKKVVPLLMEYFNNRIEEVESLFSETGFEVKYSIDNYKWTISSKPITDEAA